MLNLQDFLFFLPEQVVHLLDELVRRLLNFAVTATLLVLGDLLVLGEPLQLVVGFATNVAVCISEQRFNQRGFYGLESL